MSATLTPAENRRLANTELGLLVLAIIVVLVAYALMGLHQEPQLPAGFAVYSAVLLGIAAVAHAVTRWRVRGADPLLLPLAFLLNGLGLVMVRRIDFANAGEADYTNLAPAQAVWSIVALAAFVATLLLLRDHTFLDAYRYVIGLGAVALLLLPLLPVIGTEVNGARLWVRAAGLTFQPGELAKLGLVVFFASYLGDKRELLSVASSRVGPFMVPPARAFAPVAAAWGVSLAVLIFEKDLGLSLLFFGIFVVMLYVSTARVAYVVAGTLLFSVGAVLAYLAFGHVRQRIAIWLDMWAYIDEPGGSFQLVQSLFALGTGGIAGVGLGDGMPTFIPFVSTDFIFSAFGEELGLLGTTALLLCYFLLVARGYRTALRCADDFGTLLAAGLTTLFALQVFVILGGVTRLIPLTGLTLPFISYGGSSLLANYILIAVLLRISAPASKTAAGAAQQQKVGRR
ncbi:MAG: FtsW/RodA/SpoVE family cell cycle protein [Egibacteraceae bacterium]